MTRIFEALRKARAAEPPPAPESNPPLATGAARRTSAIGRVLGGAVSRVEPPGPAVGAGRSYPLVVTDVLEDEVIQQMTTLRISIESALSEMDRRVVVVQSSQRREGATTVALQLARTLARDERQRVFFLDAHAQHPALSVDEQRRVAIPAGAQARAGTGAATEDSVAANLEAWPVSEDVGRSGAFPVAVMRELIETCGVGCNWVIVDGPPVLESAEAAALAAAADGVILVVQAGRTKRPVLSRSVELLRKAGARVLGTVLNRRRLEIPEFIYRRI